MKDGRAREEGAPRTVGLAVALVALGTALRVWLSYTARDQLGDLTAVDLGRVFFAGLRLDGVIAGYLLIPSALLLLVPRRAGRYLREGYALLVVLGVAVAALGEVRFFDFYGFRPNYLVLDYAAKPEVRSTVLAHHVAPIDAVYVAAIASLMWLSRSAVGRGVGALLPTDPRRLGAVRLAAPLVLLAAAVLAARGTLDHRPLNPTAAAVTSDRAANELAGTGLLNVAYEAMQRWKGNEVHMADLFEPLPADEADRRVRNLLGKGATFTGDSPNPFVHRVGLGAPRVPDPPKNVVVVVMESFTGRLVGSLGGDPALSPELDALAAQGVLLTHCYATGERTVQGLEAVVSSFPPLPGVSVVRRPVAHSGFATLGAVFASRGYDTLFLYGGQGIFDSMRGFFIGNGFERFIEEDDFDEVDFRGSWGVSDEDLFRRANREFERRSRDGRPFLATILTVSLHSPWEFPAGRAPELDADVDVPTGFERDELANFLYADFAIGEFMREAQQLDYYHDTLFVFVGDHGVHLRGRGLLPSEEYRVPALFVAPGRLAPRRIDSVTSQLDLAPTILGIVGGEFRSPFFGRDVLADPDAGSLAVLQYNKRTYAARRADRLTVLSEGKPAVGYRIRNDSPEAVAVTPDHAEDARDVQAVLEVAEALLRDQRFTTAAGPEPNPATLTPLTAASARARSAQH